MQLYNFKTVEQLSDTLRVMMRRGTNTYQNSGTDPDVQIYQIRAHNPIDGTDANRYDGEAHIYLQAGATRNERRYINFRNYQNTDDDFIIGCNQSNNFIMYDNLVHRMTIYASGQNYINSAGVYGVHINYHATDVVGTDGFYVHAGGAASANYELLHVDSTAALFTTPIVVSASVDFTTNGRGTFDNFLNLGTATQLTISSGAVTVTKSNCQIETEASATADDLDTISGGDVSDVVVLRSASNSRVPTVKDGTGNLYIAGDFALSNTQDTIVLMKVAADVWVELSRSDNA